MPKQYTKNLVQVGDEMKASSATAPGKMNIVNLPDLSLSQDEVTLGIRRVGLCGTDLRTFLGTNPIVQYPRIIGHEIGAVLMDDTLIHDQVYPTGTIVTVNPYTTCGTCYPCRTGRVNSCTYNETLGNQRDGAGRELFGITPAKIIPVPQLTLDQAACIEPLSVGFHAARRGRVHGDQIVVVIGVGMIGLGVVAACAFAGARVIAVDIDDRKLETARQMGASDLINSTEQSALELIQAITQGEGASLVIEAVGNPQTYTLAIELVSFTGTVVYIGYAKHHVPFETKYFVSKELDILGSRNATQEDFSAVVQAIESKALIVEPLITHRFPFAQVQEAFELWAKSPQEVTKILLEV
jgi:threonine dehydrogenase-like Zn-dependent dehydrogenase